MNSTSVISVLQNESVENGNLSGLSYPEPAAQCRNTKNCVGNYGKEGDDLKQRRPKSIHLGLEFDEQDISHQTPDTHQRINSDPSCCYGKGSPKTPPGTPDSLKSYINDDIGSIHSYSSLASKRSTLSCGHPFIARNGTTFSGRKMKYIVHCPNNTGPTGEHYLTPTQRAHRQVGRLKELLSHIRLDLEQRDSEILKLTKEVVELQLFKASLNSPENRSNSSDAVTVRENTSWTSQDISLMVDSTDECQFKTNHDIMELHNTSQVELPEKTFSCHMQSPFADSGHFENMTTLSIHSKSSYVQTCDKGCETECTDEREMQQLINMYEARIENLIREHKNETHVVKATHNDRVEALLLKLADCNVRYGDLMPDYKQAKARINELEVHLEALQLKLQQEEEKQNKMYLYMYETGQEREGLRISDRSHLTSKPKISVFELLQQLQVTQDELDNIRDANYQQETGDTSQTLLSAKEAISLWLLGARKTMYHRLIDAQQSRKKVDSDVILQFLKSAIYYFLTDKENSHGHLNVIESILCFSDREKSVIDKAKTCK